MGAQPRVIDALAVRLPAAATAVAPTAAALVPSGCGIRVDLEDREPAAFADADAQQADAAGFVVHLLQLDFLPAERGLETVEFRDLVQCLALR